MDTVNTELIRGHVDTIILNSLAERDRYGYEILDIISDLSEGRYEIKQPTLYSCLKRLEKQGFIESYFGDESNGGRRRYYKLTQKGRETLEQDQREWEFSRTIINKLLSDREIDLKTVEAPFDPNELRPLTRRVKAHDVQEEVVASTTPIPTPEPIVKYVYIPQYIQVPAGNPLPQNGILPEGASFANDSEIPAEVRVEPVVQQPIQQSVQEAPQESVMVEQTVANETSIERQAIVNQEELPPSQISYFSAISVENEEEIATPTQQEALNALYSDSLTTQTTQEENEPSLSLSDILENQQPVTTQVVSEQTEEDVVDEETALIIKEQQTKASKLLGIGEFARHRNLLEDPTEAEGNSAESGENVVNAPTSEYASTSHVSQGNYAENNVNYREALSAFFGSQAVDGAVVNQSIASHQAEVERLENTAKARHFGDIKQSLYEDGFKLKVYQKANSINHYYLKFIYSNRINRDTALLTYLVLIIELLVMIIARKVFGSPLTYVIIGAIGVLVPLIPSLIWLMNPTKRIRAQFNMTQALANSIIAFIIISAITIVVSLLLGANMKSGATYSPVIISANIPISIVIYGMLYKSNNYHLKK